MKKAVKISILILTDADVSDEDIVRWSEDAMVLYADFDKAIAKIVEKHESLIWNTADETSN